MSAPTPSQLASDRNLLFGIFALQMAFINRNTLVAAMKAWVLDKAKSLGQLLREQGAFTADRLALLEAVVSEHLKVHGEDVHRSLAAVNFGHSAYRQLEQIADADLLASLSHISGSLRTDAYFDETRPPSAGTPTSSGLRFSILRPHARGGLGEVFVAHDAELHREVALKEIKDHHADDPNSRARFLVEAEITGCLEHPDVVPVYGLGAYPDGRPFYAMRFIRGESLQEAIAQFHRAEGATRDPGERTLALRQLLRRFIDACNAVAYAHSRGVLHRDLKPSNIMLDPFGETLVVDWGLAKTIGRPDGQADSTATTLRANSAKDLLPTQLGVTVGTPSYMSPEQARGRLDEMGPTSDGYSLGATLYCLLAGANPIPGPDVITVLRKVQRGEFPPPRQVKADVPAALEAVCLKAMALQAKDRYDTVRALVDDVEHWLADEPVTAYREPWTARLGRWTRRHKPLVAGVAAAALVVVVLGGVGAWWWQQQREQRRVDRAVREAQQRQGVETTLEDVARLQGQARWAEARVALDQAKKRLEEGGAEDLRERLDQAQRDLDLMARLEGIRLKRAIVVDGQLDYVTANRDYAMAFREAGLGDEGEDAAVVGGRIGGSNVREILVAILDDWMGFAKPPKRRDWLLQVARYADPDPWRDRLRDPAVWEDGNALMRLAWEKDALKQPPIC